MINILKTKLYFILKRTLGDANKQKLPNAIHILTAILRIVSLLIFALFACVILPFLVHFFWNLNCVSMDNNDPIIHNVYLGIWTPILGTLLTTATLTFTLRTTLENQQSQKMREMQDLNFQKYLKMNQLELLAHAEIKKFHSKLINIPITDVLTTETILEEIPKHKIIFKMDVKNSEDINTRVFRKAFMVREYFDKEDVLEILESKNYHDLIYKNYDNGNNESLAVVLCYNQEQNRIESFEAEVEFVYDNNHIEGAIFHVKYTLYIETMTMFNEKIITIYDVTIEEVQQKKGPQYKIYLEYKEMKFYINQKMISIDEYLKAEY